MKNVYHLKQQKPRMATPNKPVKSLKPVKLLTYLNDKENWRCDPALKLALANVLVMAAMIYYVSQA